jgi:hemolysin activation/secretion protein
MRLRDAYKIVAVLICFSAYSISAWAVMTPGTFTNFFDAGRTSNQLQKRAPLVPKVHPKPQLVQPKGPIAKAAKISFKLNAVSFEGNTVFSSAELLKIFSAKLNKSISLGELEDMVHQVTTKYRDAGFLLSRAILPPQVIKSGKVEVRVIEGFVNRAMVKGNPGLTEPLLQAYGDHIAASRPLQIAVLQRYALLANDLPGFVVKTLLTPSPTVPAAADLSLYAERSIGSAFISYDNFGTRYLGPLETSFGGSLYSLIRPGDSNNFRFTVTTRPQQLRFMELTHIQPLGSKGLRWTFGTNYAETKPGFVLKPAMIIGRNATAFTDFSFPWVRDRSKNFSTHAQFNYQNVTASLLGTPFYQDRIRSLDIGLAFDDTDRWRGINSGSLDLTRGFNMWGARQHEEQSRPKGNPFYARLNLSFSRLQGLTQRFSAFFAMHLQYAFEALLATEQFGVGGPDIGRGYDPSEIVGDQGLDGKFELRMDTTPGYIFLQSVQYFVFYDAGIIKNKDSVDLPNQQSLTSAGFGARFVFLPQVTGSFFVAKPITKEAAVLTSLGDNTTSWRVFFQVALAV